MKETWSGIVLGLSTMAIIAATSLGMKPNNSGRVEAVGLPDRSMSTPTLKPTFTPQPTIEIPSPTEAPVPTIKLAEVLTEQNVAGVRVFFDSEGVPVYYQLREGTRVDFNQEEMILARETALQEKKLQVVTIVNLPDNKFNDTNNPTEDRPLFENLPEDVANSEYLAEHGVTIIQGTVELHIRKSAFEEGGPLAEYIVGGSKHLTIGIINGPSITQYSFDESRFESIRPIAQVFGKQDKNYIQGGGPDIQTIASLGDFRRQQMEEIDNNLAEAEKKGYGPIYLEDLKISKRVLQLASEEELKKMVADKYNLYAGAMVPDEIVEKYLGLKETNIVLVSTGTNFHKNILTVEVDEEGKFTVQYMFWRTYEAAGSTDLRPKINQSQPKRSDFLTADDSSSSVYMIVGGTSPGLILHHELEHVRKIDLHPTGDENFDRSEWETDAGALEQIQKSYESGKYYFFLSVPGRSGYISTMNETIPERTDGALV